MPKKKRQNKKRYHGQKTNFFKPAKLPVSKTDHAVNGLATIDFDRLFKPGNAAIPEPIDRMAELSNFFQHRHDITVPPDRSVPQALPIAHIGAGPLEPLYHLVMANRTDVILLHGPLTNHPDEKRTLLQMLIENGHVKPIEMTDFNFIPPAKPDL